MALRSLVTLLLCAFGAHAANVNSFVQLRKLFANPPAEFRSLPFMVWNGDVTEADIDRELTNFKAQGAGGVFVHPRPGLVTEYLSDRWFQLVRYTVNKGKQLGLQIWLYDENSYPSGFAGGHVPAQMPESYNEGQGLVLRKMSALKLDPEQKYPVILKRDGDRFVEVSRDASGPGDYFAFELALYPKRSWHGGFSYVDLIRPGVTEKFIELTMRGYEKALGSDLGTAVPGIFTDEPEISPPQRRDGFRWTPDLFEQFQKRRGYDLKPLLPSLLEPVGDYRKVRHDYYAVLLDLFTERWGKPWQKYTESKGMLWTGHYWEHEWPNPANGPDNMAMYSFHGVPAIDMLFNQFSETGTQFGNARAVRELASVASQMGRRRTLSETYGGAGWELRFEDMKRLADWQAALGVNVVNQHLAFQTLVGERKHDYPQSFTYHEPWWNHYKVLGDYIGRISLALSTGEQRNRILVIEPTTTAWVYAGDSGRLDELKGTFTAFINRLEAAQAEYDLGSEYMIREHGSAAAGRLTIGKRTYETVILPPGMENIESATVKVIEQYLKSGGKVLAFGDTPARVEGAGSDAATRLASQYASQWQRTDAVPANALFTSVQGQVFHQRREVEDGELIFIVNSSLEKAANLRLSVKTPAVRLDALSGAAEPIDLKQPVELAPAESLLLYTGKLATGAAKPSPKRPMTPVAGPSAITVKRIGPNALTLDYCDLTLAGTTETNLHYYVAQDKVFKHYGFAEGDPWNTAVQYKTSILDRNHFPADSGFSAAFHFDAGSGTPLNTLQAVVERPALWNVTVNGHPVTARKGEWWLDVSFGLYDIGQYAVPGRNQIVLTAKPMSVHHELQPIYILGGFGLESQAAGFKLAAPAALSTGGWKDQGMPFFSDRVAYSRTVSLKPGRRYGVRLGKWNGTLTEVLVNGKSAGVIAWQPYELDITPFVRGGKNEIEVVVYGSLKNLLGPHHGKLNRGLVTPWSWRNAPKQLPPGSGYDFDAYGLFEDFVVTE